MNKIWNWRPNIGVGCFKFNASIKKYKDKYGIIYNEDVNSGDDITGLETYNLPDDEIAIEVNRDTGRIHSISSEQNFVYNGKNIIGMTLDDLSEMLGVIPDTVDSPLYFGENDVRTPVTFYDLGLDVYLRDGIIVLADGLIYPDDN